MTTCRVNSVRVVSRLGFMHEPAVIVGRFIKAGEADTDSGCLDELIGGCHDPLTWTWIVPRVCVGSDRALHRE